MTSFSLNYVLTGSLSKESHMGGGVGLQHRNLKGLKYSVHHSQYRFPSFVPQFRQQLTF